MKRLIFKTCVAALTFVIGISAASFWMFRQSILPTTSPAPVSRKPVAHTTPLSLPCAETRGDVVKVKELLASGADVDGTADDCIMMEPSPRGSTLLMRASGWGNVEVVKLLLESGASVKAANSYGETALSHAALGKHIEILNLLFEKGADINPKDEFGRTPLMSAAGEGELEVVRYLLDRGADVNARDRHGTTALMFAAGFGHPAAMQVLLKNGANPKLKDRRGRTAAVYVRRGFPVEYNIGRD